MDNAKPLQVKKSRNNNKKLLTIGEAFTPVSADNIVGTCANIKSVIEGECDYDNTFGARVAAPYVLARLVAMFQGLIIDACGQEAYKITWQTVLRHKATGRVITFYDYKGGISYGSDALPSDAPEEFLEDCRSLLKALGDGRFPHPYDGCVIGEIA